MAIARPVRPPAKFSTWQAAGNRYLLVERAELDGPLTAATAREASEGADGVLEVVSVSDGTAEILIWNSDGSQAEMSGNGTRIVARWLAERTHRDGVTVRVGAREVSARIRPDGQIEQDMGPVEVGPAEVVDGIEFVPVSVGNPHAVVAGDPAEIAGSAPSSRRTPVSPSARTCRWRGSTVRAR